MGPTRMDCTERDFPSGDEISRPEHHSISKSVVHVRHRSVISLAALLSQVRDLPLFRGMDWRDDDLRMGFPAGDEGHSHRGDDPAMEKALVLEEDCAATGR